MKIAEIFYSLQGEGRLVGSNFVTNWGSVGFFGPLTVDPECWSQGIAKRLMEPTVELFDAPQVALHELQRRERARAEDGTSLHERESADGDRRGRHRRQKC